ncbi:MAG: hypothetical protein AVDCRST_MAG68-4279 [uncultured Gemmatimonadetes bacterium]|uniref:Uncharacterized protein n=1 Tax=uncultured Gemmatimonadota bacterium TaxID=203437 RepID=A0A6J4MJE8_9BACT|nr:MAG: hypothetical protein AVDCRST_MAG68-4279 [uncultured Gemmatimonadota bacterium]
MTARRKKVHGWRRRLRELDRWAAEHKRLPLDELLGTGDCSAEIWFEQWPTPFPIGVRRRMVEHLFRIHDAWGEQLGALTQPYYLGVWLAPGFRGSRVAAAVGRDVDWYASRHSESFFQVPPPPPYHGRPLDLGRYTWTWAVETCLDRLSEYTEADQRDMLRESRQHLRWDGERVIPRRLEWWYARQPTVPNP